MAGKTGSSGHVHSRHRRRIRRRLMERDGERCVVCGSSNNLTIGHIKPRSMGGRFTIKNLQLECLTCNYAKGNGVVWGYRSAWRVRDEIEELQFLWMMIKEQ